MSSLTLSTHEFEWKDNLSAAQWDKLLTQLQGHPLQSARWGDARRLVDGIKDTRWAAYRNAKLVFMARFEERKIGGMLKIAWVPKGPTFAECPAGPDFYTQFLRQLKRKGYWFCITDAWQKTTPLSDKSQPATIWIDLRHGKDKLWQSLSRKYRSDVRRAKKKGLIVEKKNDAVSIRDFYTLCQSVSQQKGFTLCTSSSLMSQLIHHADQTDVESHLFIAHQAGQLCAGAFIMRLGSSIHYLWGATDRAYSKWQASEALQWEIIEWALEKNCTLYDLEGIDLKHNQGTYQFKKKLGGEIVTLPGKKIHSLNYFFKCLSIFI